MNKAELIEAVQKSLGKETSKKAAAEAVAAEGLPAFGGLKAAAAAL